VQYYIIFEDTYLYYGPVIIAHFVQIFVDIIFFVIYPLFGNDQLGAYTFDIVGNLQFWFTLVITCAIALTPVIISRKVDNLFLNTIINNLRNGNIEDDSLKKIYTKKIEHMSRCTRSVFKFKKFLNEKREFEPDNYVDKKMMEFVELYKSNKKSEKNLLDPKFGNRAVRANSLDIKTNFFKSLQSINQKIKNKQNIPDIKEIKEYFSNDSKGERGKKKSNSKKESAGTELNLNQLDDEKKSDNDKKNI